MKQMKSITRMTIFSTLLIVTATLMLYLALISEINDNMARDGVNYAYNYIAPSVIFLFVSAALLAYVISSLIIDRVLNPIRLMITKINDIKDLNFSKPLVIDSEDDELREYASAFNSMSRKLNGYIERQKRFISDASHEMATPITVINGHADMLLRLGKEHPELLEQELRIIKSEALRMNELIDSLLMLARSDSGRQPYVFGYVTVSRLINESVREAKLIAPDFDFEMNIDGDPAIKCDEYALLRVFRIILSNAIKYSGESRRIEISTTSSNGHTSISIKDKGIGIDPLHLSRIFDRFYRVDDSRSKKTGGSGLGLAIALEIITAHGGDIHVTSQPGTGTEFRLLLPSATFNNPSTKEKYNA